VTLTNTPRVSVIMPAYNADRFVRSALLSVMAQSYQDYEVIVVDDGSTDDTKASALAVAGPIRYMFQSNQGPAAARNSGIHAARGEFICFLDADDLWLTDKLSTQVQFMDSNPDVGLVFADEEEFDERGVHSRSLLARSPFHKELLPGSLIRDGFRKLLEENFIPTSTVLIRRTCLDAVVELFDPTLRTAEDRDLWSRIAVRFPIAVISRVLARKRMVPSSVSSNVESTMRSRIQWLQKARVLFPDLATPPTVNRLLSPTYLQLGFVLLHQSKAREARQAGIRALRVSRSPSQWSMAVLLIVCTLLGTQATDAIFRVKRLLWSM
jgi:glycosyltransferase involved in cell wall biosynthesis